MKIALICISYILSTCTGIVETQTVHSQSELYYVALHTNQPYHNNTLGTYTLAIGYQLRENLINLLGYLMNQPTVHIERRWYTYFSQLKVAISVNNIDVFNIIPILPKIVNSDLNEQFSAILDTIGGSTGINNCHFACTARFWKEDQPGSKIDLNYILGHIGYNPIFVGIIDADDGKTLGQLQDISNMITKGVQPASEQDREAMVLFSPILVQILRDIFNNQICLTEKLLGYMLKFYPWPFHDSDLDIALGQLVTKFIDEKEDVIHCKLFLNNLNHLALKPIELLESAMDKILESFCPSILKNPAKIIKDAIRTKLTIPDYKNIHRGKYVEILQLSKLLEVVNHRNYPVEIVLAAERVQEYLSKALPYMDIESFAVYDYHNPEEMLSAFLNYVLQKTPHVNMVIKSSINAIRIYLSFARNPQIINMELMVALTDAWLAPDLNDEIKEEVMELKIFILDEGAAIRTVFDGIGERRCYDVFACFQQGVSILKNDERFRSMADYFELPQCIVNRFFNGQYVRLRTEKINLKSLLDIVTYQTYKREMVLAAARIRDYISDGKDLLPEFNNEVYCTKHESLLAYLEQVTKSANFPREVYDSMRAIIPTVSFKVKQVRQMNIRVMTEITKAFHAPDSDEAIVHAMTKIDAFMSNNELLLDKHLDTMDPSKCTEVLSCYNNIADFLNQFNVGHKFPFFRPFSPELYILNLGFDLSSMTVLKVLKIVKSLMENLLSDHNEIEAAILYVAQTANQVDSYFQAVDCVDKQVMPCFEQILNSLRLHQPKLKVKVNIYQYLLSPATCDRRYCQWINYNEVGSVILNPLLEYIKDILDQQSRNVQSLHLQIDIIEIINYLKTENVDYALTNFKIKQYPTETDKLIGFLNVMTQDTGVEQNLLVTLRNVIDYLSTGKNPEYFTLNTLKSIVKILGTMTTQNILCTMETKLLQLLAAPEKVAPLFKQIKVNCTDLNTCLTTLESQLIDNMNNGLAPAVLQIIKPEVCGLVECSWTQGKFKYDNNKYINLRDVITKQLDELKSPNSPLIVQLLAESLTKNDRLTYFIHFVSPEEVDQISQSPQALTDFLNLFDKKYQFSPELRPCIKLLLNYLQTQHTPTTLNHEVLINMLQVIADDTKNDVVRSQIATLQNLLTEYMAPINAELMKMDIDCVTMEICIKNLYEKLQKTNLGNDKISNLLNNVLLAPTCSKAHCPHRISVSKQEVDSFIKFISDKIDLLKDAQNTPFHIVMDLDQAKKYLLAKGPDMVNSELVYKKNEPDILTDMLMSILNQDSKLPSDLALSLSNILSYYKDDLQPTYLQTQHLMQIIRNLQGQTLDMKVQSSLDKVMENLAVQAPEVNQLLLETPVNCTDLKTCLESLYLRLLGEAQKPVSHAILDLFQPEGCNDFTCPWLQDFVSKQIDKVKTDVYDQIGRYAHEQIPMQLQFDFQNLQHWIESENLDGIYGNLGNQLHYGPTDTPNLVNFLEQLGPNVLASVDVGDSVNNIINYMSHGVNPNKIDIGTLKSLNEMLTNSTIDPKVKKDMQDAMKSMYLYEDNVKQLLNKLPVTCAEMQTCIQSIYQSLQDHSNDPMSVLIKQMLFPSSCYKATCPWILEESMEATMNKLKKIKDMIQQDLDSTNIPLIVKLKLEDIKDYINLDNSKDIVAQLDVTSNEALPEFLRKLAEIRHPNTTIQDQIQSAVNYLQNGKAPNTLSFTDFNGLINEINMQVDDALGQLDLSQLLSKANRYPQQIEDILKQCNVDCLKMNTCLETLKLCMKNHKTPEAAMILDMLQPTQCNDVMLIEYQNNACRYEVSINDQFGKTAPKAYHPNQIVIFLNTGTVPKSIVLDLDNPDVVKKLLDLPRPDGKNPQIIILEVPDSFGNIHRISIDLNDRLTLEKLSDLPMSLEKPTIDFSQMSSIVLYVQTDNGKYVPIKLDLTQGNVREVLNQVGKYQTPNWKNPELTLVDFDGSGKSVSIDVNNNALWKQLLKSSSDNVFCDIPIMINYPGNYGDSWKSVLVSGNDKQAINSIQTLPSVDNVNQAVPSICTTGGMLQLSFNVYEPATQSVLNNLRPQVPVIHTYDTKTILLTTPDRFGHPIPLKVDLSNPKVIQALSRLSKKWICNKLESPQCQPSFIVETDKESVPIHLNFDKPMAMVTFQEEIKRVEQQTEDHSKKLIVIENPTTKEKIILSPDDPKVVQALQDIARNSVRNPNSVMVSLEDSGNNVVEIPIDTNNAFLMQYLTQLMHNTLSPFSPTTIYGDDGRKYQTMAIAGPSGVTPIVFEETQKNFDIFESLNIPDISNGFEIDFDGFDAVKLDFSDFGIWQTINQLEDANILGVATEQKDALTTTNTDNILSLTVTDDAGREKVLYFDMKNQKTYENLRDSCKDLTGNGSQVIVTRPDGQQEILYCNLIDLKTVDKLREIAVSEKEKLSPDSVAIISLPDESGQIHAFVLDLTNEPVLDKLKEYSIRANPDSDNKVGIVYKDKNGNNQLLVIDMNQVRLQDIRDLASHTPAYMIPIQTTIDGKKLLVTTYKKNDAGTGFLLLNLTDSKTQDVLSKMSEPGNPLATKIVIEDDQKNKIELFVDFGNERNSEVLSNLPFNPPSFPVPVILCPGSGLLAIDVMNEHGKHQTVTLNVTDSKTLQSMPSSSNSPKITVMSPEGRLISMQVDVQDEFITKVGDTMAKPDKNTLVVLKPEGKSPFMLDLSNQDISDALLSLQSNYPTSTSLIIPDHDDRQHLIYLDLKNPYVLQALGDLEKKNPTNILPTVIPTSEPGHQLVAFTISLDDKTSTPVLVDNRDGETLQKLISLSDMTNPNAKLIIFTDDKGNSYPLHLDLSDSHVKTVLSEADKGVQLPNAVLTNPGDKVSKYIEIPTNTSNEILKCDITNTQILTHLQMLSNQNWEKIGTTFSVLQPTTKKPLTLILDLNHPQTKNMLREVCKDVIVQPSPDRTFVVMVPQQGVLKPVILDMDNAQTHEIMNSLNQDQPTKATTLVQYVDDNGQLKVFKIDFTDSKTQEALAWLDHENPRVFAPTEVTQGDGSKALIFTVKDHNNPVNVILNVDNPKVLAKLSEIDSPEGINTTPITFIDSNGKYHQFHLDLDNPRVVDVLKQFTNDVFSDKPLLISPVIDSSTANSIAIWDRNNQVKILHLDFNNSRTMNQIMDLPYYSKPGDLQILVSDGNRTYSVFVDIANDKVQANLEGLSSKQEIIANPGSLIIIPSTEENKPYVLDITNDYVKKTIKEISANTPLNNATHIFTIMDNDQKHLIKMNMDDQKVKNVVQSLSDLTPWNIRPSEIIGPDGKPLVLITITDKNKNPHQFLLDLNDQRVIREILGEDREVPKEPLYIDYHDHTGQLIRLTLDKLSPDLLDRLHRAQKAKKLPITAIKNTPISQPREEKLILPIEQENGNNLVYTFDLRKPDVVNKLISLSSDDMTKPALVVYLTDENSNTRPVRLYLQDDKIINQLQEIADDISAEYTQKSAMVFMLVNDRNEKDIIILDKDLDGVIHGLKEELENNNPILDRPISIVNVVDTDGNPFEIKVSPYDKNTNDVLRKIEKQYTPKIIKPFPVRNPNGELPLIVFAVKTPDGTSLSIALDQNQPEVVDNLKRLSVPKVSKTVAVPLTRPDGRIEEIHIDTENPETIKTLQYLTQLTPMFDTPIMSPARTFVCEVVDVDNNLVKLQFDTRDGNVVQTLIDISKQVHPKSPHYVGLVSDQFGNPIPIRLDIDNPETVDKLIRLAQRFIYPKPMKVIPSSGYIPLQIFDIPIGTFSFPITIDCNNASVIAKIQQKSQRLRPGVIPVRIMACENQIPILIDLGDSDLAVFLTGVSVLSYIMINPKVIIPAGGRLPIISMQVEQDYGQASMCLDLNQLDIVRMLLPLQPMYKEGVTTFFYGDSNTNKKHPITLDLKNTQTLEVLKQVTSKCTVRLIPIIYRQPILEIISGEEVFKLDLNNPVVKQALEDIGKQKAPITGNEIYLEIPNRGNLPMPIYIDLQKVRDIFRELTKLCLPPTVTVIPPRFMKVQSCFATILSPMHEAPLALIYVKEIGPICLDINNQASRNQLMGLINGPEPRSPTYFMIPNMGGDIFVLKADLNDFQTINLLKSLTSSCMILYEPNEQSTNVLSIRLPKKVVSLDMNRPDVLEALAKLSKPSPTQKTYSIYMPKKPQSIEFHIDIDEISTQEVLYAIEKPKLDPFFFELKYQDLDSSLWKIVIDVNSDEIMDKLVDFSKQTTNTPNDGNVINVKLYSPQGRTFDIKLDKTNPLTLQFLKDLTRESTNKEPEILIQSKPKLIQHIDIADNTGKATSISIDVNNINVLKKLQQIADSQTNSAEKTTVQLTTPDGSKLAFSLDLKDITTVENLQKLSVESERHIPAKLKLVKLQPKRVLPILVSFPVTAPFVGAFTVTVDVGKIDILERLRLLAREFIPGRSESQVEIKDNEGRDIFLKLDLTNSTTVYRLVMMTIDSTGHNPTGIDPIDILNHVTYVPDVLTIEVPDGFEIIPISFDRSLPEVVAVIKRLYNSSNSKGTNLELIEHGVPVNVVVDSTNQKVLSGLRSISIQTIVPRSATQMAQLITIIFLKTTEFRYIPLVLDLSNKENVMYLMSLVAMDASITGHETYLEVRDDYGQYVTVGVDLSNLYILNSLIMMAADVDVLEINATKIPYLTLCFPDDECHKCVKIKMKSSAIEDLMHLPVEGKAIKFRIIDALHKTIELQIDPTAHGIMEAIASTENAAMVLQPLNTNMFVLYHGDQEEVTPIYVDITNQKTMEFLRDLHRTYSQQHTLAVVRYTIESTMRYFTFTIDVNTIDMFLDMTASVSAHAIVKQKLTQKTTIYIPSNNGANIPIILDMADKDVVQGLKDVTNSFDPQASPTLINLEDAYGYPLQLKIDIYNENTIGRLIQLSNKQSIF